MNNIKPSAFASHPFNSVLQKTEHEVVARNIMVIRKRLGDQWPLEWSEYKRERLVDGDFSDWEEKQSFEKVMPLIPDAIGAIAFSPEWAKAARKGQSLVLSNRFSQGNPADPPAEFLAGVEFSSQAVLDLMEKQAVCLAALEARTAERDRLQRKVYKLIEDYEALSLSRITQTQPKEGE